MIAIVCVGLGLVALLLTLLVGGEVADSITDENARVIPGRRTRR